MPKLKRVNYIVIHCSASPPDNDIGVEEIRKWHLARGFSDVGYHIVITRNGIVQFGRPIDQWGAHAAGFNSESIGICLVGGVKRPTPPVDARARFEPENNFTLAQWNSLEAVLLLLREKYPKAVTLGHRDLPGVRKDCPCFDVRKWLENK